MLCFMNQHFSDFPIKLSSIPVLCIKRRKKAAAQKISVISERKTKPADKCIGSNLKLILPPKTLRQSAYSSHGTLNAYVTLFETREKQKRESCLLLRSAWFQTLNHQTVGDHLVYLTSHHKKELSAHQQKILTQFSAPWSS